MTKITTTTNTKTLSTNTMMPLSCWNTFKNCKIIKIGAWNKNMLTEYLPKNLNGAVEKIF